MKKAHDPFDPIKVPIFQAKKSGNKEAEIKSRSSERRRLQAGEGVSLLRWGLDEVKTRNIIKS